MDKSIIKPTLEELRQAEKEAIEKMLKELEEWHRKCPPYLGDGGDTWITK